MCFECRVDYLEGYAADQPPRLHAAIAAEAERAATLLLRFGDKAGARRAVSLCHKLGYAVPATAHRHQRRIVFPG